MSGSRSAWCGRTISPGFTAGDAFGEAWAFLPVGALIVDFVLTIAISSAAGASALIAYVPALAAWRIPLALALTAAVAAVTWLGHLGRSIFAVMTCAFIVITAAVLVSGLSAPVHPSGTITTHPRSGRADRARWPCRSPWRWPPGWKHRPPRSRSWVSSMTPGDPTDSAC